MDFRSSLLNYGKKQITVEDLAGLLKVERSDVKGLHDMIKGLTEKGVLQPVKSSGVNGNIRYPLYKKYRITIEDELCPETVGQIGKLHPMLLKSGYLSSHPSKYISNRDVLEKLNLYLFRGKPEEAVSRKERSFEIFGCEKVLDDDGVKRLLRNLQITEEDLKFYDTPEYCFHDYIPERKENLTLLICENKDIWFNIRRCMFENHYRSIFGVDIDGVVYGNGNEISQKKGAFSEYVRFMGSTTVRFLYWGDIDREGFDIYRRTKEVNDTLDISLFVPGYRKMIERARELEGEVGHGENGARGGHGGYGGHGIEDSPSSKKGGMCFEDLLVDFTLEERAFLNDIFRSNKLIPQEIIPYTLLSER